MHNKMLSYLKGKVVGLIPYHRFRSPFGLGCYSKLPSGEGGIPAYISPVVGNGGGWRDGGGVMFYVTVPVEDGTIAHRVYPNHDKYDNAVPIYGDYYPEIGIISYYYPMTAVYSDRDGLTYLAITSAGGSGGSMLTTTISAVSNLTQVPEEVELMMEYFNPEVYELSSVSFGYYDSSNKSVYFVGNIVSEIEGNIYVILKIKNGEVRKVRRINKAKAMTSVSNLYSINPYPVPSSAVKVGNDVYIFTPHGLVYKTRYPFENFELHSSVVDVGSVSSVTLTGIDSDTLTAGGRGFLDSVGYAKIYKLAEPDILESISRRYESYVFAGKAWLRELDYGIFPFIEIPSVYCASDVEFTWSDFVYYLQQYTNAKYVRLCVVSSSDNPFYIAYYDDYSYSVVKLSGISTHIFYNSVIVDLPNDASILRNLVLVGNNVSAYDGYRYDISVYVSSKEVFG